MAGFQNSNKLYTDSSNTPTALTTASAHYPQTLQHPNTPTSPAPTFSNTTTTQNIKSESPRTLSKNTKITTSTTTTNTQSNNSSSSNPNSPAGPRSLTSTATQTTPPVTQPHSAFSPYQQQPVSVTNPNSKNSISSQPESTTMMTTSHLDNSGSTALIYPPPTSHFPNPTTHPFWQNAQWGFSGANGTAVLSASGGSAFVPAVGYGAAASNLAQGHTPRPKLTTTIWEDEQTLCYQVDARGICVARRQDNDMINGTKLLNVVGMSRGKRDGILKNEKGRVVVKVGAMHLKGVWITFQRAKTLAAQFKISDLLYPLFVDDPSIFLHNSYGPPMSTRIPSIGGAPGPQWRPHPYANNFNNAQYSPDSTRQWYPYSGGNPLMGSPSTPQGQEHGSAPYPQNAGYADRSANVATPPAVPIYPTHPPTRGHTTHPQAHLEEYDAASYNLINGQSQGQGVAVVSGAPAVSSYSLSPTELKNSSTAGFYAAPQNAGYLGGQHQQRPTPPPSTYDVSINRSSTNSPNLYNTNVKTEDNNASSGNGYIRSSGQGLYNLVSAVESTQGSSPPLIGQKRGFVGEEENDDYNNTNQPSPPLSMHPPPPLSSSIAVSCVAAAGSFPSPMHVSPNSSPGGSAFSGWSSKRVKYEQQFPEATTPSSSHSSPRNSSGYQLPSLGAGPATPGANPSTPGYTNSNLQMVTNAQGSPHHYSSATNNTGGSATGTTTPTTDGLDRYFEQGTVLHTPSPDGTPVEETGVNARRYEYRQREEPPATEELAGF